MMRCSFAATLAAVVSAGSAFGTVTLMPGKTEVVVAPKASSVTVVAAQEMTNYLSKVFGTSVPLVRTPTEGKTSVILGINDWSKAAGVDPTNDPHDTFVIKADAGRVYIAGVDGDFALERSLRQRRQGYGVFFGFQRATMHGVYDFLERCAGVRFYFPDEELGTIVPQQASIVVPDGVRKVTPDFLLRNPYFGGDGKWHVKDFGGCDVKSMHWMHLRLASTIIPCCHGSRDFKYIERFGKTHPEYLALKKDGSRRLDPKEFAAYQLCWTNPGFKEELYQDVKAYLTGQPASSRGLKGWGNNCKFGKWVDIMPDDSFQGCFCKDCQAAYTHLPGDRHYASELMWSVTAEIGRRLIKEGVEGNVTMMAYPPYRRLPDVDLPPNVWVMVAEGGPWSLTNPAQLKEQYDEIRAWKAKLGHKIWIWTYPSKFGELMIKGVPCVGPHAWAKYYTDLKDAIIGGFMECESDRAIYNFLNYYVFSRVMWDASADPDAILDELYADLFGAAQGEMKAFFALLERQWTTRVVGNVIDTPLGPKTVRPDNKTLWTDVYSPAVRAQLDELLKTATEKVGANELQAKRIALMRAEFFDRMVEGASEYEALTKGVESLRFDISKGPLEISASASGPRAFKGCATVKTTVEVRKTADDLVIEFNCVEPKMDLASCAYLTKGCPDLWRDNNVEVMLNPNGDRKTMFHFILSSKNVLAAESYVKGNGLPADWKNDFGVKTETSLTASGWKGTFAIPLKSLGEMKEAFPASFCRSRTLTDGTNENITWSSYVNNFHDVERYGTVVIGK